MFQNTGFTLMESTFDWYSFRYEASHSSKFCTRERGDDCEKGKRADTHLTVVGYLTANILWQEIDENVTLFVMFVTETFF